jgi:hypothetical protein
MLLLSERGNAVAENHKFGVDVHALVETLAFCARFRNALGVRKIDEIQARRANVLAESRSPE